MSLLTTQIVRASIAAIPMVVLTGCSCNDYDLTPFQGYEELTNDHGQWLSMGVSPDNRLAVSYFDRTYGALGFALGEPQDDGTVGWVHEQVDGYPDDNGLNPGVVGEFCSLAVAQSGIIWISYTSKSNGALKVAKRERKEWTVELVDVGSGLSPQTGLWSSIAMDANDQPVVAYHDATGGTLKVATRAEDGTWSNEVVHEGTEWTGTDANGDEITRDAKVGEFADLLIDGNTQYISFYDNAQQSLQLLEGPSGARVHSVIDVGPNVGTWSSMALNNGALSIAYQDVGNQDLKYAIRGEDGVFVTSAVDTNEYVGADTEIFIRDGAPHIVYFDGKTNDMKVAGLGEDGWTLDMVGGETEAVGFHNEVVQDLNGDWWAASFNYTKRNIFAKRLGQ